MQTLNDAEFFDNKHKETWEQRFQVLFNRLDITERDVDILRASIGYMAKKRNRS